MLVKIFVSFVLADSSKVITTSR